MKTRIIYFSGTGNTELVVRQIESELRQSILQEFSGEFLLHTMRHMCEKLPGTKSFT